jgi:hypothetical protein
MSDKLTEIMAWKRQEIAPSVRPVSLDELRSVDASLPRPPSLAEALRRPDGTLAVIAEIKRRSPSAGAIAAGISAREQALRYRAAGASALSILTDERYFGGTLADLREVTAHFRSEGSALPCLRKDFMVHPIQVLEAREAGASAILIIVRALDDEEIATLAQVGRRRRPRCPLRGAYRSGSTAGPATRGSHHWREQSRPRHFQDRSGLERAADPAVSAALHRRERKRHFHRRRRPPRANGRGQRHSLW